MRKLTTEEFIIKAKAVHGDKYDYSKSSYINSKKRLIITCPSHGEFEQRPNDHLNGCGCSKCMHLSFHCERVGTLDDFLIKSSNIHGCKYKYENSIYTGLHNKLIITCITHGDFAQTPAAHIYQRQGCSSCGGTKRFDADSFIRKAHEIHGFDIYDYSNLTYNNSKSKVCIKCRSHGWFSVTPNNHLRGRGCPSCAKTGFDKLGDGFVYFLIGNGAIKVGITNNVRRRVQELKSRTKFDFEIIKYIKMSGVDAVAMEKRYHRKYESAGMRGFDGCTEWLKYSKELMSEIMNE